jgi:hypothetical protein
MSEVVVVEGPDMAGLRSAFVLREDRIGHYPEFRDFFARSFDLERVGLTRKGHLRTPSGMVYAVVFIGRSGEPFPAGLELFALAAALEPLDEASVDRDLWAILCWMIEGVGAPWTQADLEATGRLYRVPAAVDAAHVPQGFERN